MLEVSQESKMKTKAMQLGDDAHRRVFESGFTPDQIKRMAKLQKAVATLKKSMTDTVNPRTLKIAENLINNEIAAAFNVHGNFKTFGMTDIPNIYKFCRGSLLVGDDLNKSMIEAVEIFSIKDVKH